MALESCPRNSPANFWDQQAAKTKSECPQHRHFTPTNFRIGILACAFLEQDNPHRRAENGQIEQQPPILDVEKIVR